MWHDRSGATAVEFALVLPVLIGLLLGVIQFGVIFSVQAAMQAAAKSGARTVAVQYDRLNGTFDDDASCKAECEAEKRAKDAAEDSLSVWWDLFFAGTGTDPIAVDCVEPSADVSVWETTVSISLSRISLVDFYGIFTGEDEWTARATWPAPAGECPSS